MLSRIVVVVGVALLLGAWTKGTPSNGESAYLRASNIWGPPNYVTPDKYYNPPGKGNPAISTADYYHMDGLYWLRPYDLLDSACGSAGVALAASRGRYIWMISPDHPNQTFTWDAAAFRAGFSNDPGVLPSVADVLLMPVSGRSPNLTTAAQASSFTAGISGTTMTVTAVASGRIGENQNYNGTGVTTNTRIPNFFAVGTTGTGGTGDYIVGTSQTVSSGTTITGTQTTFSVYQTPYFVCNPDDVTYPFYIFGEGNASSIEHEQGLFLCDANLVCQAPTVSHPVSRFGNWSSFQRPVRTGPNTWYSTGLNYTNLSPFGVNGTYGSGKYTNTDSLGRVFTSLGSEMFNSCLPVNTSPTVNSASCPSGSRFGRGGGQDGFTVGGQAFAVAREETGMVNGARTGPQYVTRAPIGANFGIVASPSTVRISGAYGFSDTLGYTGFPGPTYLQDVSFYSEDGVMHYYALVGFPSSGQSVTGGTTGNYAPYLLDGGLWEQNINYYTEVIDATAAAQAAPIGVTASAASGVVTISWYDALPNRTYRVYKGSSSASQTTLVGDVTGTTITDSPTTGQQWWYKVVTMEGATERKNRVVHVYVSSSSAWVNAHINRVIDDGGDAATIDRTFIDKVYDWLVTNDRFKNLEHFVEPRMGVKCNPNPCSNGSQITAIYDFGTTRLPRGGDLRTTTANTTYQATAINSTSPGWVNGTSSAYALFGNGRMNNIRRKVKATFAAAFQSTGDAAPLASGATGGGIKLYRASGNVTFDLTINGTTGTATKALGACTTHIIGGTWDDASLYAWYEGVKGSVGTALASNSLLQYNSALRGQYGLSDSDASQIPILVSGAPNSRYDYTASAWPAGFVPELARASFTGNLLMFLDDALTDAEWTSFVTMIRTTAPGIGAC